MIAPFPRKKAKGDAAMRPYRIGRSSASRVFPCSCSTLTGSARPAGALHSPWDLRDAVSRAAFPRALRSSTVAP
jgi:hypothetical protein